MQSSHVRYCLSFQDSRSLLLDRSGIGSDLEPWVQAVPPESKLSNLLQELAGECEANRDSIPPEPAARGFLFEGQLSNDEPATVSYSLQRMSSLHDMPWYY